MNYVVNTANYGLIMPNITSLELIGYTEANWASDVNDRHSTSGYIILLDRIPLVWRTAKQKCLSLSSMEAEFVAITDCAKELLWLRNVMDELGRLGVIAIKTRIYSDNQSAIHYANNNSEKFRTQHIDVRLHYIRELLDLKVFEVLHVCGKLNPADFFTKAATKDWLEFFLSWYFSK